MKRVNDEDVYRLFSQEQDHSYLYIVRMEDELVVEIISKYGHGSFNFDQDTLDFLQLLLTKSKAH